jgi:probable HAF family extracellular repeat protein
MKSQTTTIVTGTLLLAMTAAITIPTRLEAQEQKKQEKAHHHYKLIDMGTFGGTFSGLVGPASTVLSESGSLVGISDTPNADPFSPNFCFFNCFIDLAFVWRDGTLTELGPLPGGASSIAAGINGRGQIIGQAQNGAIDPLTGWPEAHAALWDRNKIVDLGTLGGSQSNANAINGRGEVVGAALTAKIDPFANVSLNPQGTGPCFNLCMQGATFASSTIFFPAATETHAFLWRNGKVLDLGTLGGPDSNAWTINARGEIAGWSFTSFDANPSTGAPTMDPFFWSPENGKMIDIGSLGGTSSYVTMVNDRGQVAGASNLAGDGTEHPFLWSKSTGMLDLGTLGGTFGHPDWLNDLGEVVGFATTANDATGHAFLWRDGVMTDLGTLGTDPFSEAASINSKSQIVGATFILGVADLREFLWENGGPMVDLNTLVLPGSNLSLIGGGVINDRGEISCGGVLPNGDTHACLLIPCDEDHPNIEGCDYDPVDPTVAAQAPAAPLARTVAATASQPVLSPAERIAQIRSIMARRRGSLGTLRK